MSPDRRTRTDPAHAPPLPSTLLGTLSLELRRGRPILTLTIHCPACRGPHHHGWGFDPWADRPGQFPAAPTHRTAHCWRPGSPYSRPSVGYYVAPADTPANARVLEQFADVANASGVDSGTAASDASSACESPSASVGQSS